MSDLATEQQTKQASSQVKTGKRKRQAQVVIFPNWCKGCGLCVEFCPATVFEQQDDGRITAAHPERCTGCRWCELHCPDFAIFVTEVEPEEQE